MITHRLRPTLLPSHFLPRTVDSFATTQYLFYYYVIEPLLPLASHFPATSQFNNIDTTFSSSSCLPQNHPAITTTRRTHPIPRKRVEMAIPQRRCVATPANRTTLTFAKSKMLRPLLPLNHKLSLLPLVFVTPLRSLMIYGRAPDKMVGRLRVYNDC